MRLLSFVLLCIVWGTTWVAMKITLEGIPPFLGSGVRFFIASAVLILIIFFRNFRLSITRNEFYILILNSFLAYTVGYGFVYWGAQYINAGVTSVFFATFPLFTSLFSVLFFRNEKFHPAIFIGIIISLGGTVLVFFDQLQQTETGHLIIAAIIAITIGAAAAAMSIVIIKKYLSEMNVFTLAFHQMMYGAIQLTLVAFFMEGISSLHLNTEIIIAILYLGIVGSAMTFATYFWLLKKYSAVTLSLMVYITPIVALISDFLWYHKTISGKIAVGIIIIFSGIALTQYPSFRLKIKMNFRKQINRENSGIKVGS